MMPGSRAESKPDQSRIESLDLLRALAVLLVLGHHAAQRFRPASEDVFGGVFLRSGWIGVDIFFVISGFMITRILLQANGDIGAFFRRRAFRIVPIFAVAVATFGVLSLVTGSNSDILHRLWSPALFLNGWTIPVYGYEGVPYTITWSLSVEEFAYIILGLSALRGATGLKQALAAFLVIAPLTRVAAVGTGWIDSFDLYFFVLARLDSIALGGLAASGAFDTLIQRRGARLAAGLGMAALIFAFQFVNIRNPVMPLVGYLVFALVTAVFVAGLSHPASEASADSNAGPIAHVIARTRALAVEFGQLSYFIYLFHMFALECLRLVAPWLWFWPAVALAALMTFVAARVSWRWFEAPLIARGRRASWRAALHIPFAQPVR